MSRIAAIALGYGWSCAAGAAVMLFGDIRSGIGFSAQIIADALVTGFVGGLVALPVAFPLIMAAERWRWHNPLIYSLMVPAICLAIVVGVRFVPPEWFDIVVSAETSLVVYAPSIASPVAVLAAVATYWVLRGRMSGALS